MFFQFFFQKYQTEEIYRAFKEFPNLHVIPAKVRVLGWPFEPTDNILETDGMLMVTLRDLREEKTTMSVFMDGHIKKMEAENWLIVRATWAG